MEVSFKPRMGRPKAAEPLNEIESIPVSKPMKEKLRSLKNQGLLTNEMARDFLNEIIRQAEAGKIEGISKPKSA